ncbi:MAG TPA: hypothetical protein VN867_05935 [Candidatus Binataceae bacterium]|jgi:hypothetical protein|nr:hypothetical protein [Candidatus Binataceae bacterium]
MNPAKILARREYVPNRREMQINQINQTDIGLFLSIPAAARELGVSIKRLTLAIDLRQVPAIQLGRRKVVPRAAIEKLAQLD